ncbi:hypothetical protein HOLleu_24726 [Holothuria leucospilota]|uniref:Uncharacterized protein n=1 Tax=Holothuria leucospilota TaxID=206669 RepID=A0A9Q1H3V2_HOLLE|nr:hypothetical protein HOLleu_24726 [Holothuria leucospilota]
MERSTLYAFYDGGQFWTLPTLEEFLEEDEQELAEKMVLQTEKDHLEEKVDELKEELAVACQVLPDNVAYLQTGDNTEEDLISPAMIHPPVTSSTPYKQPLNPAASVSIYSELKAVSTGNTLTPVYGILPVDSDNMKEETGATTSDEAVEMVLRLRSKKQAILKEVEEIMKESSEKGESSPMNGLSKEVVTCISKEMDHILDQMKVVAKAKQNSDERAKKLSKLLKEIASEKESLLHQYEDAVSKLQQLNYDQHQLELVRAENEILEHSIEQEKSRLSLVEQRLLECQEQLRMAQEREKKWKLIVMEALTSQSDKERKTKEYPDQNFPISSGRLNHKSSSVTKSQLSLLDALSLEIFPAKLSSVLSGTKGFGATLAQKEVHPTYSTSCKVEAPGSSPVTNKCEPNLSRAKSWDLTFTTATDQSSQSLAEALGEDLKAADSCYDTASSRLVYCNLKVEETVTPNLREDSFASFKSQDNSVDSNNNFELRYLKQEGGDGTHLRRNKKSLELRDELSDKKTSKDNSLSVKVFREVAIQTIPINSGARVKKPNKPKKDTLPKLNLPSESSLILEEKVKETDSLPPNSPPQSPHSPLLTIPKLSIPDSPHSHDSDSLSSSFSFKTANSSPPQSPGATSNNSSREADVSSEGLSSYTSSSSPPDLFFSCTEGDLSRKLSEKMEKQVDENFNKGLSQSDRYEIIGRGRSRLLAYYRPYARDVTEQKVLPR